MLPRGGRSTVGRVAVALSFQHWMVTCVLYCNGDIVASVRGCTCNCFTKPHVAQLIQHVLGWTFVQRRCRIAHAAPPLFFFARIVIVQFQARLERRALFSFSLMTAVVAFVCGVTKYASSFECMGSGSRRIVWSVVLAASSMIGFHGRGYGCTGTDVVFS